MKLLFLVLFSLILCSWQHAAAQLQYPLLRVAWDSVWQCDALRLYPIYHLPQGYVTEKKSYVSLPEAIQKRRVQIDEVDGDNGADIKVLRLRNKGRQPILLTPGDIIKGGKQDRMVTNMQLLMPDHEWTYIDVLCVEKGRWADSKVFKFSSTGRADYRMQEFMLHQGAQQHVWKHIDSMYKQYNDSSSTWSYTYLFNATSKADTGCITAIQPLPWSNDSLLVGWIAVTHGSIISIDVYAAHNLFKAAMANAFVAAVRSRRVHVKKSFPTLATVQQWASEVLSPTTQARWVQQHGKLTVAGGRAIHLLGFGH
ncbi:MAG: ARPP-1 family domain-containing protein [Chitinophagaceae bacterium]